MSIEKKGPYLIAGLGNPGARYEKTRHNIGFMILDMLAEVWQIPIEKEKFSALYGRGIWEGKTLILVKPLTFMNLSGKGIRPFLDYFRVSLESFLAVYDDIHLPLGKLRYRKKGSSGGHRGVESVIQELGTNQFDRIKIGIGPKPDDYDQADFVLAPFTSQELEQLAPSMEAAVEGIKNWVNLEIGKHVQFI